VFGVDEQVIVTAAGGSAGGGAACGVCDCASPMADAAVKITEVNRKDCVTEGIRLRLSSIDAVGGAWRTRKTTC
jgi:hypothetical protein